MCSDRDMMNLQEQLLLAGGHIKLSGLSSQVLEPAMLLGGWRPEKTDHSLFFVFLPGMAFFMNCFQVRYIEMGINLSCI